MGGKPAVHPRDIAGIAQAQVVVADAAAARQQMKAELLGVQVRRAADALEVALALARGGLQRFHDGLALQLELGQRRLQVGVLVERMCQRDGVFHRQLGARADGKVGGMRGIAE